MSTYSLSVPTYAREFGTSASATALTHRSLVAKALMLALAGLALLAAPSPAEPDTGSDSASVKPTQFDLVGRELTAKLTCTHGGRLAVRGALNGPRLGSVAFACHEGRARTMVQLSSDVTRLARQRATARISVNLVGDGHPTLAILDLQAPQARPAAPLAKLSSGGVWNGPDGAAFVNHPYYGTGLYVTAGRATFGYAFDTMVWWQSMLETYNASTGAYKWLYSKFWFQQRAGTLNDNNRDSWVGSGWVRPAIRVYGSSEWNYVSLSIVQSGIGSSAGGWLYFH
jgi:hypothetical protein